MSSRNRRNSSRTAIWPRARSEAELIEWEIAEQAIAEGLGRGAGWPSLSCAVQLYPSAPLYLHFLILFVQKLCISGLISYENNLLELGHEGRAFRLRNSPHALAQISTQSQRSSRRNQRIAPEIDLEEQNTGGNASPTHSRPSRKS